MKLSDKNISDLFVGMPLISAIGNKGSITSLTPMTKGGEIWLTITWETGRTSSAPWETSRYGKSAWDQVTVLEAPVEPENTLSDRVLENA